MTTRRDDGLTLVELLITMALMATILLAIAYGLGAAMSITGKDSVRVQTVSDAETLSTYYNADVQSASQVTTLSTQACGGGSNLLLGLQWQDGAHQVLVSYTYKAESQGPSTRYSILRLYCTNSTTPVSTTTLAQSLVAQPQPATIWCDDTNANITTTCPLSGDWVSTNISNSPNFPGSSIPSIQRVDLVVGSGSTKISLSAQPANPLQTAAWDQSVTGVNMTTYADITLLPLSGAATCPELTVGGTGSSAISVTQSGNQPGSIVIDSTCSNPISLASGAAFGNVLGTTTPNTNVFYASSSSPTLPGCQNTACQTYPLVSNAGGSLPASATSDPFASLPVPSTTASTTTCTYTSSNYQYTCQPGYRDLTGVTFPNNAAQNVYFTSTANPDSTSNVYEIENATFKQGCNYYFGSGTYYFTSSSSATPSLQFSGSSCHAGSPTQIIAQNLDGTPASVLLYFTVGSASFPSTNAVVSLRPISAYHGIDIWDAAGSSTTLALSPPSTTGTSYGGVYSPSAKVTVSSSSACTLSPQITQGFFVVSKMVASNYLCVQTKQN